MILFVLLAKGDWGLAQVSSTDDSNPIAPYRLVPHGSARSMAMGGAYTGLSVDISALVYNPAGLVFGTWKFDVSLESSRISDKEVPSSVDKGDMSQPVDFLQGGLGLRLTDWLAIAGGLSNPYQLKLKNGTTQEASVDLVSAEVAIAVRLSKFSFGIGYHIEEMTQTYVNEFEDLDLQEKSTTAYPRFGMAIQGKRTSLGLSYASARSFPVDQQANSQMTGGNWFRNAEVPSKTSLGVAHRLKKRLLVVVDYNVFGSVENAIYPGSGETLFNTEDLFVEDETKSLLHGGFEWTVIDKKNTNVLLRGGYYNEPKRLTLGEDRAHFTFGAEVRLGPAKLTVSFDQAPGFTNTSQGFSLVVGSI